MLCLAHKIPDRLFVSTQIDVVPARDVINAVKEELAPLADKSTATVTVKKGDCSANDTVAVVIEKTSVDIALKTVSTRTDSPTAGATNFPVGSVLLTANHTWSNTLISTQMTTYTLDIAPNSNVGAYAIRSLPIKPNDSDKTKLLPANLGIADAILAARDEILAVDHSLKPCVIPRTIKVEVDFQIERKNDTKFGISLIALGIGSEHIKQADFTNSIIATFTIKGTPAR